MACYHPLRAFQCAGGAVVFDELQRNHIVKTLDLPCGRCPGCKLERSRQWAVRCMHEATQHDLNSFLTLTYNNQSLPPYGTLLHRDYQLFFKRLRKAYQPLELSYYMCGEYGERKGRPHYHACLFGLDFSDKRKWKKTEHGHQLWTSDELEQIWGNGKVFIGQVTFESAAYVARYIMKKVLGDEQKQQIAYGEKIDVETGEIIKKTPEYNHMSLKYAIGKKWLEKYQLDIINDGKIVVNGRKVKAPKYYDRTLKKLWPDEYEKIAWQREKEGIARAADNTDERLATREKVKVAQISTLLREIE